MPRHPMVRGGRLDPTPDAEYPIALDPDIVGLFPASRPTDPNPQAALLKAPSPTAAETKALRRALLAHYDAHARALPWRGTSDPYAIWISEVMSQQTRVETVIPYWERWLARYPSVEALAKAEQDDVLKSWEGLGYYSRARNLHAGAAVVRERFSGALPSSSAELLKIPGIGPYTAGAIASIAFGEAVPAVDGNVRRVFSRLFDIPDPTPAQLREHGLRLIDPDRPGDFNQSVMELGATVCTPRNPRCGDCPVRPSCGALAAGTVDDRPIRKKRAAVPDGIFLTTILYRSADRTGDPDRKASEGVELLLERRGPGLLEGMWSFPETRMPEGCGSAWSEGRGQEEALRLAESLGLPKVDEPCHLGGVTHVFTHLRATYQVTLLHVCNDDHVGSNRDVPEYRWTSLPTIEQLAVPTGQKRIVEMFLRGFSALGRD